MKPHVTLITLGVDDLDRALHFYRDGLGLPTDGIVGEPFDNGRVVFFALRGGLGLALFERRDLALDAQLPVGPRSPAEFSLAHNVASEAEVDTLLQQAVAAGARLTRPAGRTFWGGYAGYFQDPDGHLWEVAFNPQLMPPSD